MQPPGERPSWFDRSVSSPRERGSTGIRIPMRVVSMTDSEQIKGKTEQAGCGR